MFHVLTCSSFSLSLDLHLKWRNEVELDSRFQLCLSPTSPPGLLSTCRFLNLKAWLALRVKCIWVPFFKSDNSLMTTRSTAGVAFNDILLQLGLWVDCQIGASHICNTCLKMHKCSPVHLLCTCAQVCSGRLQSTWSSQVLYIHSPHQRLPWEIFPLIR